MTDPEGHIFYLCYHFAILDDILITLGQKSKMQSLLQLLGSKLDRWFQQM
jgi:hypothetical protein